MQGDLLWVYEGLTEYLGVLLSARSGLWKPEDFREHLAFIAANLDYRGGRNWRPLGDTATAAQLLYAAPGEWFATRRGTDFYDEGVLLWLEADTILQEKTQGKRSLDDFCRRFHGGQNSPPALKSYDREEVIRTLNEIAPNDWKEFFAARIDRVAPRAPLGGIENGGWKLVYNETPNEYGKAMESANKQNDFTFSVGGQIKDDGTLLDVIPSLPLEKAGIAPGMKIIAVNGRKFSPDIFRAALKAGKVSQESLELLVENGEVYKTYRLDYHNGERFPHLERKEGRPDTLTPLLKALTTEK